MKTEEKIKYYVTFTQDSWYLATSETFDPNETVLPYTEISKKIYEKLVKEYMVR